MYLLIRGACVVWRERPDGPEQRKCGVRCYKITDGGGSSLQGLQAEFVRIYTQNSGWHSWLEYWTLALHDIDTRSVQ